MSGKNVRLNTPIFRVSFPNVFKPKLNALNGKEEYSVVALFPAKEKAALSDMLKAMKEVLLDEYGSEDKIPKSGLMLPFHDGNEKYNADPEKYPMYKDTIVLNLKSISKPGVRNPSNTDYITDPKEFYGGCFARASVNCKFWKYEKIKKGVNFYLNNLQKVRDGESFSGRTNPEDDFDAVEGLEDTKSPVDSLGLGFSPSDDEIPF